MTCKVCETAEGLDHLISALGDTPVCLKCYENFGERAVTIHNAYLAADRAGVPIHPDITARIRVYLGDGMGGGMYDTMRDYLDRMTHQQLVPMDPARQHRPDLDEERDLMRMKQKIIRTRPESRFRSFYNEPKTKAGVSTFGRKLWGFLEFITFGMIPQS